MDVGKIETNSRVLLCFIKKNGYNNVLKLLSFSMGKQYGIILEVAY